MQQEQRRNALHDIVQQQQEATQARVHYDDVGWQHVDVDDQIDQTRDRVDTAPPSTAVTAIPPTNGSIDTINSIARQI